MRVLRAGEGCGARRREGRGVQAEDAVPGHKRQRAKPWLFAESFTIGPLERPNRKIEVIVNDFGGKLFAENAASLHVDGGGMLEGNEWMLRRWGR